MDPKESLCGAARFRDKLGPALIFEARIRIIYVDPDLDRGSDFDGSETFSMGGGTQGGSSVRAGAEQLALGCDGGRRFLYLLVCRGFVELDTEAKCSDDQM